jgi:glucan-binding YG repeat protein
MIFQTFDNDVNGIINKIGIFGKSFSDIIENINSRKIKIDEIFLSNGGHLKAAKEQAGSIWTYIFPKKVIDDSLLTQFEQFKEKFNSTTLSAEALAEEMGDVDASIITYAKTQKNGQLTTEGFTKSLQGMTLGAKAATIGMKALAVAGNILVFAAISKGIQLAIESIDNYVHRVEKAKEALSTSVANLDTTTNDVKELEKQLDEINQKISDINSLGGAQVSKDGELEKLQEQHDQLEANLALMREQAYFDAKDVADKASDSYNTTVTSQYKSELVDRGNNSRERFLEVAPTEELELSISAYKEYSGQLSKINNEIVAKELEISQARANNQSTKALEKELATLTGTRTEIESRVENARKRSMDMAKIINDVIEANKQIENLQYDLTPNQLEEFEDAKKNYSEYDKFYKQFVSGILTSDDKLQSKSNNSKKVFNLADEDTAKEIDDFQKQFATLSSAIDKVKNSSLSGSDLLDLQQEFPALIDTTDDLDVALNKLVDETLSRVISYLESAGASDGLIEIFRDLANEAKGFKSSSDSVMELTQHIQESYDLLTKIQKEVDKTKQISLDSLNSIAKQYPELTTATAEYAQGLISTSDLMALLEQAYNNDANAFRTAMAAKLDGNEVFFNTIKLNNEGLFTALAKAYGVDVGNWKTMAQAKAEIDQALIQKLGAAWGQYYGVVIDQATGLASLINKTPTTGLTTEQSVDLIVARTNAESMVSSFNHAKEAMDKAAQIEIGLPDFGGIGGKSGSGGSKGSKGKEASEFDWMEQKIALLDSQVDKLKTNIESLVGYKNKNSMTNTAIDVLTEKMTVLQQMHDEYMKKASGLGLSQEYIDKVQNGTIEIESIGDENLAKVIKEYQDLYDKAQDTNAKILETQKSIHDLNLSKLDNIIDQFKQTTDIQSQMIDTEKQLLDLREKSGEEIYVDDYISLAGKQLRLTRQNADAYNTLAAEMSRLNLQEGTEEWKKYNDQLEEYKGNMISAADAIEQYKDAMTELAYKGLRDFTSAIDSINGTISTMNDLIGDTNLVDTFGNLTDRGLAQIALYAHQMTNAKQEAAEYAEAIKSLDDALDSGLITQDEYNSMLQDYTSAQENAVKSSKEARDAILALVKEGIQAEIDAKKKLVDETKAALDAEKDLHDYQKSISEKQDNISKLERQIAALSNSTNRDDIAKRLQLQSQLADAKDELYELQYDHEIEQRKNALDDEYNAFEESKQKESDELDTNLDAQNAAIDKYLEQVKNNYSTVYGILTQYGDEYSLAAIDDLTKPWESGSEAADLCAGAIGDAVANIQYEIDGLDFSSLYELVDLLNQIGMGGYGGGSSSAYEDVTDQGSWQKGKGGKWWYGNSNDDYVSGDIYTINGKQYGFDDDGYMVTGWRDDFGDWRYFEPENGEMVISQWRKSKDGDWYYLDKDGVMATDMAVKARDGDGYYYLDENGKYDGKPLTAEQVRKLGYTIGYKKGRKRIPHDQLAWTQENKPELITRPSDGALLTPLKLGDGVINGDLTQNLLDIAGNPNRFIEDIVARSMPHYKIPEFDIVRNQPVAINSPLVQIDGTGLSATEVAAIIKNETRDIDKRVAKSIGYELMGK